MQKSCVTVNEVNSNKMCISTINTMQLYVVIIKMPYYNMYIIKKSREAWSYEYVRAFVFRRMLL